MPFHLTAERNETIGAYDAIHQLYDAETRDFWERFPASNVREFVSALPGKEVLNLGSGPGRDSLILRDHGLDVTCVDGSRQMVRMTAELGFRSLKANLADMTIEGVFDGIWAYSSLIHLTFAQSKQLISSIQNNMRPGGVLFLGLIEGTGNETRNVAGSKFARYFEYYDAAKVESLLAGTSLVLQYHDTFRPGNHTYLNYIFKKGASDLQR